MHRQALVSKSLSWATLCDCVNYIKFKPLQSWLFGQPCREMGTGQDTLLFHSEVRWLTHDKVLQWVDELCLELCKIQPEWQACHCNAFGWIAQLAYRTDVFNLLNKLNLSRQGRYASNLEVTWKLEAKFFDTNLIPAENEKKLISLRPVYLDNYFNLRQHQCLGLSSWPISLSIHRRIHGSLFFCL